MVKQEFQSNHQFHTKRNNRQGHNYSWWRHEMETFSALLAICPVPGEFHAQRPVTRSFDVFFICVWINGWVSNREAGDLRRHRPLWRHRNVDVLLCHISRRTFPNLTRKVPLSIIMNSDLTLFTHCVLVTLYSDTDLGHHWFRRWLFAWRQQEPVLTYHQRCSEVFTWEHLKCSWTLIPNTC